MIKIFCKTNEKLSLESVKGFILGSAKTIVNKCLKAFDEDFPKIESTTIYFYLLHNKIFFFKSKNIQYRIIGRKNLNTNFIFFWQILQTNLT